MAFNFSSDIVGHRKIKALLENSYNNFNLPHSYIFYGPKSIGKFQLSLDFANQLLGKNSFHSMPDLMIINSDKIKTEGKKSNQITVNEIRELEYFLRLTPANNLYRIGIIDDAENMNYNASNALLKILEEPGNKTIIFLIANSIFRIAPTVRSRCVKIRFDRPDHDDLLIILKRQLPDISEESEYNLLLKYANEDIHMAVKIYKENAIEIIEKITNCISMNEVKYADEIFHFASINNDRWDIVKNSLINCAYNSVKFCAVSQFGYNAALKKAERIINLINMCEKDNLDKNKVITSCLQ